MGDVSSRTVKHLYCTSGNRCAFEGCSSPLFTSAGVRISKICHINAARPGGPRFDPSQSDAERHGYDNLILMCIAHADQIDTDAAAYSVELLRAWKARSNAVGTVEISKEDSVAAAALLREYKERSIIAGGHVAMNSPGAIQGNNVTVKISQSKVKVPPHPASIAASLPHRNHIQHLIRRYNDFASREREGFSHAAIYKSIERQFKATWGNIPVAQFEELTAYLRRRIDGTKLGKINQGKGSPNYSPFTTAPSR